MGERKTKLVQPPKAFCRSGGRLGDRGGEGVRKWPKSRGWRDKGPLWRKEKRDHGFLRNKRGGEQIPEAEDARSLLGRKATSCVEEFLEKKGMSSSA